MSLSRRAWLAACAAALAPRPVRASLRIPSSGALRLPLPAPPPPAPAGASPYDPARVAPDLARAWPLALVHETLALGERPGYPLLAAPPARAPGDPRTALLALRDGLAFANGQPVTAASVLAAWNRARANPLGRLALALCLPPAPFDAPSALTLRVRLASPEALDELLGAWPLAPVSARGDAGLGAFVPTGNPLVLARNARAPEGGAFLERVELAPARARNDEVRAFTTLALDASWRAAGLYEVRRAAQEVRGATGTGAVVGVIPSPRGALDRADVARALEAALAPLASGAASALAALPFAPAGARGDARLLASVAPELRLARDPLDAFTAPLADRAVALLDTAGVRVSLVTAAEPADLALRAIVPIGSDPAAALASFLAVAGDEAGGQSVLRTAVAARTGAASSAWSRATCAVLGRATPVLYLRDDLAGATFDPAGRIHLGDAFLRPHS